MFKIFFVKDSGLISSTEELPTFRGIVMCYFEGHFGLLGPIDEDTVIYET
jgi:hypothetical protein